MASDQKLFKLGELHGLQSHYLDMRGKKQRAEPAVIRALLKGLGVHVSESDGDVETLIRDQLRKPFAHMTPTVLVSSPKQRSFTVNLKKGESARALQFSLELETGEQKEWKPKLGAGKRQILGREVFLSHQVQLPVSLPVGYHQLTVTNGSQNSQSLLLSAPQFMYTPPKNQRSWGVFTPLYALKSKSSWGIGSFSDLEKLGRWQKQFGANLVATLPLLAGFLDRPFTDPSPYSPVSRLFWNELYIDVDRVPELKLCPNVLASRNSTTFAKRIEALQDAAFVDYTEVGRLKRSILEPLAAYFFASGRNNTSKFKKFLAEKPEVLDYAQYRALCEKQNSTWRDWPERLLRRDFQTADFDRKDFEYHLYVQYVVATQLDRFKSLYLDFPLGVHAGGFDVWKHSEQFLTDVSVGSPPDPFFPGGQNWGFPPLDPRRFCESQNSYLIAAVRNHMRSCDVLRIDHVMGLHRLYCIPNGGHASQGAYMHYPSEFLYAMLKIESNRHSTVLIGEDLGTVPPEVRTDMRDSRMKNLYVLQYEVSPNAKQVPTPISDRSLASLNTHDMPTFAAFRSGADIAQRIELKIFPPELEATERRERKLTVDRLTKGLRSDGQGLLDAVLDFVARGKSHMKLINLEDLWGEIMPQNMPGTWKEYPNWQKKLKYTFEAMSRNLAINTRLKTFGKTVRKSR